MTVASNERSVRRYYACVDGADVEALLALFDPDAVYFRQGTPTISGITELRRFYTEDRVISSGEHTLDAVLAGTAWVAVRGTFNGVLKTGEDIAVEFTDWFHFSGGLIDKRQSLFPGRAV